MMLKCIGKKKKIYIHNKCKYTIQGSYAHPLLSLSEAILYLIYLIYVALVMRLSIRVNTNLGRKSFYHIVWASFPQPLEDPPGPNQVVLTS